MPTASLLFTLTLWVVAILILVVLYPFLGGIYQWGLLSYPLALGLYIAFIWGVVLTFSVLQVEFRDLKHLVEIAVMFLFWLTLIGYSITALTPATREIISLNPLTQFILLFHALLYNDTLPAMEHVEIAAAWTIAALSAGMIQFQRNTRRLVEDL